MREYVRNGRVMTAILDDKAEALGDKVFVRDRTSRLTYGELSVAANRVANFLIGELGAGKDDKIAVMLDNGVDFFRAQFGIAKSGAVMVPINVMAKGNLLSHLFNNSGARIAIVEERFLPAIDAVATAIPTLETLLVRPAAPAARPAAPAQRTFKVLAFGDLFTGSTRQPPPAPAWCDPVDIFYTSGSTGVSKGVVLTHNHHYTFGLTIARSARLGPDDVMYVCLPMYHGMSSYMSIMPMLLCGGSVVLGGLFSASKWLDEIRQSGATVTWAVYSMAAILMKQPARPDDADNPLAVYLYTGMPADMVAPLERRFGVKAIEFFGSTESAGLAYTPWDQRRPGAIGRINSEYFEVKVVDENDEEVPTGEIGECVSRCKYPHTQMKEYYRMPEETAKLFRNCWLHSGDLCRVDADGWIYFVGRSKDTIRRRGENISCYELETTLSGHHDVAECAAVAVPSEVGEDEVKVFIAARDGASLDLLDVLRFCEDKMPKFMVPRYLEVLPEIPKLPNHKIDKVTLTRQGLNAQTWDAERGAFLEQVLGAGATAQRAGPAHEH